MKRKLIVGGSVLITFLIIMLSCNVVSAEMNIEQNNIIEKSKLTFSLFDRVLDDNNELNDDLREFLAYLFGMFLSLIVWLYINIWVPITP